MFRLKESELRMCEVQGEFFMKSLEYYPNLSSYIFIRRFMKSNLARHLDETDYYSDSFSLKTLEYRLNKEFPNQDYGKDKLSKDALYWIGFIYRYWAYYKKMSSNTIYGLANGKYVSENYFEYHTYSNSSAVDLLLENSHTKIMNPSREEIIKLLRKLDTQKQ